MSEVKMTPDLRFNLKLFKFESTPQKLKQVILDEYEAAKAKKKKDDFDKMFIQTVKQKMKQVRMKMVVTHIPSSVKKSWVIETEEAEIDKTKYMAEVLDLVRITRESKKKEIKKVAKRFDGANYETIGGVFLKPNLINHIGTMCTTNDPFVAKSPKKNKAHYIGVELEFNPVSGQNTKTIGAALKAAGLARYVHVGEDGSCGGMAANGSRLRGFEVRVLLEESNFMENLVKVCNVLKGIGFKTDATCGTHIHLDMRNRDVKRSYANLFQAQLLLRKFLTYDRKHNIYCVKNEYSSYDEHTANATGRESRRCGINTLSYQTYKTLEIRMHQGTLDPDKLAPFIKLLLKIVNFEGNLVKTVHTLKQAKEVLKVEEPLFKDLSLRLKTRGA
jgi:hypothetical protein